MNSAILGPHCLCVPQKLSQTTTTVSGWIKHDTTIGVYRRLRTILEETESSSHLRYDFISEEDRPPLATSRYISFSSQVPSLEIVFHFEILCKFLT